jgi:hypothetical protein
MPMTLPVTKIYDSGTFGSLRPMLPLITTISILLKARLDFPVSYK